MYCYTAYGLQISSEFCLPELLPGEIESDIIIREGAVVLPPNGAETGKEIRPPSTESYLSWEGVATFLMRDGCEIIVEPAAHVDERVLRLFLLGSALGVLLHQRGLLVLHASAVSVNAGAVAFIGWKGWGKSTTAAALHARGHGLIADDVVAMDMRGSAAPIVYPGFPQLKLWPEAVASLGDAPESLPRLHPQNEKRARRVDDGFSNIPLPLTQIYILDAGSTLEISSVSAQEAFMQLVRHSYALRFLGTTGVTAAHFKQCALLASRVPISCLKRPASLEALPELAHLIEEHVIYQSRQVAHNLQPGIRQAERTRAC
jgi:hypothetical protein